MRLVRLGIVLVTCLASSRVFAQAPSAVSSSPLTLNAATTEALDKNLDLIATRAGISIADADLITAHLRPNPVLSLDGNHLDWLGTGFNSQNAGGPVEYGARVDFLIERGGKRARRIDVAREDRAIAEAQVMDAVRTLRVDVQQAFVDMQLAQENLFDRYEMAVRWTLRHAAAAIGTASALVIAAVLLAGVVGTEFLPQLDEGVVWIRSNLPPGISLDQSAAIATQMRRLIRQSPEVNLVMSQSGRNDSGMDPFGPNRNELLVDLKPYAEWPSGTAKRDLVEELSQRLNSHIPGATFNITQPIIDTSTEIATGSFMACIGASSDEGLSAGRTTSRPSCSWSTTRTRFVACFQRSEE